MTVRENLLFAAKRTRRIERHRRVERNARSFSADRCCRQAASSIVRRTAAALFIGSITGRSSARFCCWTSLPGDWMLRCGPSCTIFFGTFAKSLRSLSCWSRTAWKNASNSRTRCSSFAMAALSRADRPAVVCGQPCIARHCAAARHVQHSAGRDSVARSFTEHQCARAWERYDLQADYFPGHLKGDQVHLLVTPTQLQADPAIFTPHPERTAFLPISRRAVHMPDGVRLEFAGGLQVEDPREPLHSN